MPWCVVRRNFDAAIVCFLHLEAGRDVGARFRFSTTDVVKTLAKNALVEIEAIAIVNSTAKDDPGSN